MVLLWGAAPSGKQGIHPPLPRRVLGGRATETPPHSYRPPHAGAASEFPAIVGV